MTAKPTEKYIGLLAAHKDLAAASEQIGEILKSNYFDNAYELRTAAVNFFFLRPNLSKPHTTTLTALIKQGSALDKTSYTLLEKHPELLNITSENVEQWLLLNAGGGIKPHHLYVIRAIMLNPELAFNHTRALTDILFSSNGETFEAVYTLLKKNPNLRDVSTATIKKLLSTSNFRSAIKSAWLNPKAAHPNAEDFTTILIKEGEEYDDDFERQPSLSEKTYDLLKEYPYLLDVSTETLKQWLNDKKYSVRLGAIRAIKLNPKLAEPHSAALTTLLRNAD